jgi:protein gp37
VGEATKIEWCHHTFNPWWGCVRVSPGCEHCYAEAFAKRTGHKVWGVKAERRFFGDKHWAEPLRWDAAAAKAGERRRVFCASMADVFEDRPELVLWRDRLWQLIDATPWLDWLLLTKRPTAEDQQRADERIPHLLATPAAVRFVSYEPALGPVDFRREWMVRQCRCPQGAEPAPCDDYMESRCKRAPSTIDWIICGGESGPGARPFNLAWAERTRMQCRDAGVAYFFKQAGAKPYSCIGHDCPPACNCGTSHDCQGRNEYCLIDSLRDRKGGDLAELPERMRVRQFPEARA